MDGYHALPLMLALAAVHRACGLLASRTPWKATEPPADFLADRAAPPGPSASL